MKKFEQQYLDMIVALLFLGERGTFNRETEDRRIRSIVERLAAADPGWDMYPRSPFLSGDGSAQLVRLLVHRASVGKLTEVLAAAIRTVLCELDPVQGSLINASFDLRQARERMRTLDRRYPFLEIRTAPEPEDTP